MSRPPITAKSPLTKRWSFGQCLDISGHLQLNIFQPKVIPVFMF